MRKRGLLTLHPFLLAAYPVLHLLSQNLDEVDLIEAVKPLVIVLVVCAFLLLIWRALLRNAVRAAIVTSLIMLALLSYGYAFRVMADTVLKSYLAGRNTVFLPSWSIVWAAGIVLTIRTRRNLGALNGYMNVFGIAVVALALAGIAAFQMQVGSQSTARHRWRQLVQRECSREALRVSSGERAPDIYYIILDEYVGRKVLESFIGADEGAFFDSLKRKGFFVAAESRSSYLRTYPSVASSMNLDYVQALAGRSGIRPVNDKVLGMMIRDSKVVRLLKNAGYRFIFFPSDYHATNSNPNADLVMVRHRFQMNEFESVLFNTTLLQPFDGWSGARRKKVLYAFEELPEVAGMKGPKFVFAHITVPHPPYVFNADGSMPARGVLSKGRRDPAESKRLYAGQVAYANKRLRVMIERILARSETKPVIILQGDHGLKRDSCPGASIPTEARCSILNAYYLPGVQAKMLRPSISPVSSFRIVFDLYFGARYPLLPEVSYKDAWVGPVGRELRFERLDLQASRGK